MVIFPGRFQPFHKGHSLIIKRILSGVEQLVIGIVIKKCSFENPFSLIERIIMIRETLKELNVEDRIIMIPVFAPKILRWKANFHLLPQKRTWYVTNFDKRRYEEYRSAGEDVKIISVTQIIPVTQELSGARIREAMVNDEDWGEYVYPSVRNFIESIDGVNRIKSLYRNKVFLNQSIEGLLPKEEYDEAFQSHEVSVNLQEQITSKVESEVEILLKSIYQELSSTKKSQGKIDECFDIIKDLEHVLLVKSMVLELEPNASKELQIAALFHDIERVYERVKRDDFPTHRQYKAAHARIGANIVLDFLEEIHGLDQESLSRISYLIENHEFGGEGNEIQILRDADAIGFLLGDVSYYEKRRSPEIFLEKLRFTYNRLSNKGKEKTNKIAKNNPQIRELISKMKETFCND